eukprot:6173139-Pleurochrysis_carterae.AAC.1
MDADVGESVERVQLPPQRDTEQKLARQGRHEAQESAGKQESEDTRGCDIEDSFPDKSWCKQMIRKKSVGAR